MRAHFALFDGIPLPRLVETSVPHSKSSIGRELLWLLVFLVIFAIVATLMLVYVVPHHFNDRVAMLIAAILSGLLLIALRRYADRARNA